MKKHLKKLRPLLLLTTLFLLTNCQEEFEENKAVVQQKNGSKHTILTGEAARAKKAELLIKLNKDGGKGLSKLQNVLKGGSTDPAFRQLMDIKEYIDDSEVYSIEQANGNINNTFRVNMPDAGDNKFHNLVVKTAGTASKTVLLTYNLSKEFAEEYQNGGDILHFSGEIEFDILAIDEDFPCEEEPGKPTPVSGGSGSGGGGGGGGTGGGGTGGGGIGGPGNPGDPGVPYNQGLVDQKFQHLKFMALISWGGDEEYDKVMNPRFFRTGKVETGDIDNLCGDEEDIGVLDPAKQHEDNCEKLRKLIENDSIKKSLISLKGNIEGFKERLFTFNMNGSGKTNAKAETNNSGNSATMFVSSATYGVAHTHPSGTSNLPSGIYKMFSMADLKSVYTFAKNYAGTGPTAAPLFFNMMVIDGYTYIVFPNNVDAFKNLSTIFENPDRITDLDEMLNGKYNNFGSPDADNDEALAEAFLQFINKPNGLNLNMSLYRIKNNNAFSEPWEKLELDPKNNNTLKYPTPCKTK